MRTIKHAYGLPLALVVAVILVGVPSRSAGQGTTFTPYSGFRLGGSLSIEEGDLDLDEGPFLGAQIDFRVRRDATVAVILDYQPTSVRLKEVGEPSEDLFDLSLWYLQVGGTYEVLGRTDTGPLPFVVGTLGMSLFDPGSGGEDNASEYGLAGIFGGGIKLPFASGRMGLRLQARVLINNLFVGDGGYWCGTGGCYVSAGGPIGPVQFDFGGGLTFGGR